MRQKAAVPGDLIVISESTKESRALSGALASGLNDTSRRHSFGAREQGDLPRYSTLDLAGECRDLCHHLTSRRITMFSVGSDKVHCLGASPVIRQARSGTGRAYSPP
jgi:hypothetical protein